MDTSHAVVATPTEFTAAERAILWTLAQGRCTPSYLAAQTGLTAEYCRERLAALRADDYVERVHRGLYALA